MKIDGKVVNLRHLQDWCGGSAKQNGWHEDRPKREDFAFDGYEKRLLHWQMAKISLMHSELSEAVEELRKGFEAGETYYEGVTKTGTNLRSDGSPAKPEGVPSELADVVIRIMDFCYTEGIDLEQIIDEKLRYNATRGHRHGGKAV